MVHIHGKKGDKQLVTFHEDVSPWFLISSPQTNVELIFENIETGLNIPDGQVKANALFIVDRIR